MEIAAERLDALTERITDAAAEVHRTLGPGLLEAAYRQGLALELAGSNLSFRKEVELPVTYRGFRIPCGLQLDFVVEDLVLVEVRAIDPLKPIQDARFLAFLKHSKIRVGLLVNFNRTPLSRGIRRVSL